MYSTELGYNSNIKMLVGAVLWMKVGVTVCKACLSIKLESRKQVALPKEVKKKTLNVELCL